MSRRSSLRLDNSLLDQSLPHSSTSFSGGGTSWRSSRSLKSRRSQHLSVTCSESLLHSPHPGVFDHSLHSDASDASLLSSLVDESSLHESTVLENIWESTMLADAGSGQTSSIPRGSEVCRPERPIITQNRLLSQDWRPPGNLLVRKEKDSPTDMPIIYSRERSRGKCTDLMQRCQDWIMWCHDRSLASLQFCHSALANTWQMFSGSNTTDNNKFPGSRCGGPGLKGRCRSGWVMNQQEEQHLCEDCKKKEAVASTPQITMETAGKTARKVARWISGHWFSFTASILVRVPMKLVLVLLPLILLGFLSWRSALPEEKVLQARDAPDTATGVTVQTSSPGESTDPAYIRGLEQSLKSLWMRVDEAERRAEQRHDEMQKLQANMEMLSGRCSGETDFWLRTLLNNQLSKLRRQWDEDQFKMQVHYEKKCSSRLDEINQQLQRISCHQSIQDVRKNGSASLEVLSAVDHQSHDQSEFESFKHQLKEVQEAVDSLLSSQKGYPNRDLKEMVRKDLQVLVFGDQQMTPDRADGPAVQESLLHLLSQQFASRGDVEQVVESLEGRILQNVDQQLKHLEMFRDSSLKTSSVTRQEVNTMLTDALRTYSQDRTGLADYALESGGASILNALSSDTYETKAALMSLFGVPLWYFSQSPRVVIQPEVQPGNCWSFRGPTGYLAIRLSMKIFPTMFSLEHIPRSLAPGGTVSSAPRDFNVYGLDDDAEEERGVLLGTFTYDQDEESLQSFAVDISVGAFQVIKVHILSNWGHQDYTCMYRFRVHGTPSRT